MNIQQASDEFLNYMDIEKNCSPETIRSYALDLQLLIQFLHEEKRSLLLTDMTSSTIRRFIQYQALNNRSKAKTLQRRISCMRSFAKFCCKELWIKDNFMAGIETPKAQKKLPVYMRLSELQQFLRYLEGHEHPYALRNELMFKLLATTGMRRSELVSLTWEQIDLENNTVLIRGKGNKERLLPLHPMVLSLFPQYMEGLLEERLHPNEPVFTSYRHVPLNARSLHRLFKELLSKAGLPAHRFSLHHLRHTFATLLLQRTDGKKVDLRTLQELLGHENLATVSVYTHIDFEQKKQAIDSFEL